MTTMRKPKKPYWEMTADELAEATKEFDREFVGDEFKPLRGKQKARWLRAAQGPTRSVTLSRGAGRTKTRCMTVELDAALARRIDRYAKTNNISVRELVERGLRQALEEFAPRSGARKSA